MKVKEIMTDQVVSVERYDPVTKAAGLMKQCDIGSVPVRSE